MLSQIIEQHQCGLRFPINTSILLDQIGFTGTVKYSFLNKRYIIYLYIFMHSLVSTICRVLFFGRN